MAAAATSVLLRADAAAAPKVQARPDFGPVELPSGKTTRFTLTCLLATRHAPAAAPHPVKPYTDRRSCRCPPLAAPPT